MSKSYASNSSWNHLPREYVWNDSSKRALHQGCTVQVPNMVKQRHRCRLSVIFGPQSIKNHQGTGEAPVSQTTLACSSPEIATVATFCKIAVGMIYEPTITYNDLRPNALPAVSLVESCRGCTTRESLWDGVMLADPDRLSSPVHRNPWILDNPQRPHW